MTVNINHDVRVANGKTVYLPAWCEGQSGWASPGLPDIYQADATQKYPLGTKFVDGERVFYYAKAGGTLNTDLGAQIAYTQHVAYTTIAAAAVAGATTVVIDVAGSDGVAGDGVIAANELAGGYLVVFPHSQNSFTRRIVSNTAVGSGGGEMTLVLGTGIPVPLIVDTHHGECMASPFLNVQSLTTAYMSVIGIPVVAATIGQFCWLQTWGPVWIAPQTEVSVGNNNRQVVFRHDGSIDELDASDAAVAKAQHAGFVLVNASGGSQGAAFIMLQICP